MAHVFLCKTDLVNLHLEAFSRTGMVNLIVSCRKTLIPALDACVI